MVTKLACTGQKYEKSESMVFTSYNVWKLSLNFGNILNNRLAGCTRDRQFLPHSYGRNHLYLLHRLQNEMHPRNSDIPKAFQRTRNVYMQYFLLFSCLVRSARFCCIIDKYLPVRTFSPPTNRLGKIPYQKGYIPNSRTNHVYVYNKYVPINERLVFVCLNYCIASHFRYELRFYNAH